MPPGFAAATHGGSPLPEPVRAEMESFFHTDFSDVRVHVGQQAPAIGALAFAMGSHLYFAPGLYQPDTARGRELLGHELAHVVQQRQGRVRNPYGSGTAIVVDPALEAEADRAAQSIARTLAVQKRDVAPAASPRPPSSSVQRRSTAVQPLLEAANNPKSSLTYKSKADGKTYFQNSYLVMGEIYNKIKGKVSSQCGAGRDDVIRILRKYMLSPTGNKQRLSQGRLDKNFTVESWNALADLVIYEYKSEKNYDVELELAMIIASSPIIERSVNKAIEVVAEVIGSSLRKIDRGPYPEDYDYEWSPMLETSYKASKTYHPFLLGSPSIHGLVLKGDAGRRTLEEGIATLHDMLERVWRLYTNLTSSRLAPSNPLARDGVTVTTGNKKREARTHETEAKTKAYTRSLGIPTEMGPSFTTARFLSINRLLDDWDGHGVWPKPSALTNTELQHLALAIFAYWTLSYRKGYSGAHTWFDVADAARSCGLGFPDGLNYPKPDVLTRRLNSVLRPDFRKILDQRKGLLRQGFEQSRIDWDGLARDLPNPMSESD